MAAVFATPYGGRVSDERVGVVHRMGRGWSDRREQLRERPVANLVYRAGVAVIGFVVLVVGILAIPFPGPGWAIFFVGLGILATEFGWAKRMLIIGKARYDAVMGWFRRQHIAIQGLGAVSTIAVVIATLWFVGALSWTGGLFGVEWPWLKSPVGLGS